MYSNVGYREGGIGMLTEFKNLDLIELISERHSLLRRNVEQRWNESNELHISKSEWYIIARIYGDRRTIAYVSKNVEITRQATHKLIKNMVVKGLVEVFDAEHNKKEKCIRLTELGNDCYKENEQIKHRLEQELATIIGQSQVDMLKIFLNSDWPFE